MCINGKGRLAASTPSTAGRTRSRSALLQSSDVVDAGYTRGMTEGTGSAGALTFRWSHIAVAASTIAVASLGTLTVIATVQRADTLATVALLLAILAFIIQIVVFIAQAWTSGQQMLQSQSMNADTQALLAELRETARATNDLLIRQFDRVL